MIFILQIIQQVINIIIRRLKFSNLEIGPRQFHENDLEPFHIIPDPRFLSKDFCHQFIKTRPSWNWYNRCHVGVFVRFSIRLGHVGAIERHHARDSAVPGVPHTGIAVVADIV